MSISAACRWFAHRRLAAPMRASPRAAFRCSNPAAPSGRPALKSGRFFSTAASDRLGVGIDALEINDGTISGPGNVRTSYWELAGEVSLERDATPGAAPKVIGTARAGRKFGPAAGYSRQGFRAIRVSFTIRRCPACCMAACCGRKCRRAKLVGLARGRRARRRRPGRHRARRQFRRRGQRNRGWRRGRAEGVAQGRDMVRRAKTLPDENGLAAVAEEPSRRNRR